MNTKIFQLMFYMVRFAYPKIMVTARLPLAQALLESASWTSPVYKATNNMFGMMFPQARNTCAIGKDSHGYAVYRSPLDSIRDYFLWLTAFELTNDGALDTRLSSNKYAADPKYYKKVTALALTIDSQLISPAGLAAKTLAGVLATGVAIVAVKKATS